MYNNNDIYICHICHTYIYSARESVCMRSRVTRARGGSAFEPVKLDKEPMF